MTHLLDTNICIHIINERPEIVLQKFKTFEPGAIGISSITIAELKYGAYKSQRQEKNLMALQQFSLALDILEFDELAADKYGAIRADLERKGTPIGAMDMLIAAHALSRDLIVVTNNVKEFSRVEGLKIENWVL